MRQVLCNSNGALIARMPRPAVEPGCVLVKVHYSMVSVGTEIAPLRASVSASGATPVDRARAYASTGKTYLGLAIRNPRKAVRRLAGMAKNRLATLKTPEEPVALPPICMGDLCWNKCVARDFSIHDAHIEVVTDDSEAAYQVMSNPIEVPQDRIPIISIRGTVHEGAVAIGLLNDNQDAWLGSRNYDVQSFEDRLIFDPRGSRTVTLVITTAGAGKASRLTLDKVNIHMVPPTENGLPHSELEDQGWNVGYSVAGEVTAVGDGVTEFVPGDLVACSGAGKSNHADFVSVPKNLVCRIPKGCSPVAASSIAVGSIALQGIRRAAPQLGERICVLGLGLIGQMTVQMLRANGCQVIGLDPDDARVVRAKGFGMDAGATDPDALKALIRDMTGGHGADRTLITAATKSDAVINLAMDVTRAKGTVVIVGDVGLNVQRAVFYKKEIDLLMSTSYGAGRYDRTYEEEGRDYPLAHVRWTLNRNMQAYLEMIASGRIDIDSLIDRMVPVDDAPSAYRELARSEGALPLGVVLEYPHDTRLLPEAAESSRITIRGHRPALAGPIHYALVGAGAFGTCMLVPQMQKRKDRFFLRGVVSRNSTQGGNFARTNQVEVLATDLEDILRDPRFSLVVIATRHHEHAEQVVRSLKAGKHVFVEKPLALTWEELDRVVETYEALDEPPLLMVGFNRRFSPVLQALKENLKNRRSPLIVNYRLNGGYIPLDSWIQGGHGGGRNIGEACHMYDVFRFLAGAPVKSVSASSIDPGSLPYLRNDNFCASLAYADGSVGNLVYTALGPKQGLPKERIEVFCDGDAYVVDDFKSLTRASDGKVLWQSSEVDKGHFEELSRLGDAIAGGGESPIPFDEIVETTAVSLQVEDLLFNRLEDVVQE